MQSKLTIRFARENDWDEIEQITSQNFSFQRDKQQELNGFRTLLLEFDEQVIGSCLIQMEDQFENSSLKLLWLEILPDFRKQGFGTLLLATLKSLVAQESLLGIQVTCQEELIPYFEMNDFQLEIGDNEAGVEGYQLIWYLSL